MTALDGKVALVTGASKGIGQALAVGLAEYGAAVAVNYRNDEAGARATSRSIEERGGRAVVIQADVGDSEQARNLVDTTVAHLGAIDVLVNNAARTRFGPAAEVTDEDWNDALDTNLRGPFFASLAAAKHMNRKGGGSIVNISSCAATLMIPYHAVYTAAKGGLEALTRQLALELAPEVRVNAIAPSPTSTERNRRYDPNYDASWGQVIPLGRVAYPEDFVGPLVFLASDQSGFLTGEVLHVDGGWTLKGDTPPMQDYDFVGERQ